MTVTDTSTGTPATAVQTSAPDRVVPTRRIDFDTAFDDLPRHFAADGNLFASHLAALLSASFPPGEDYFVRSVRRFRDRITDPALQRQVAGFIGQETVHSREHAALNARLDELGYPAARMARMTDSALRMRERLLKPITNLAITAAIEHFTATLAEQLLRNPEARAAFGHEALRDVFTWHALEEAEHKAVAFDVYRAVGGSERRRIWAMKITRAMFVTTLAIAVGIGVLRDPAAREKGRLRRDWRQFRRWPIANRSVWRTLRRYDEKGFHPDQIDTDDLVAEWSERLFGDHGTLTDRLVGGTRPADATPPAAP